MVRRYVSPCKMQMLMNTTAGGKYSLWTLSTDTTRFVWTEEFQFYVKPNCKILSFVVDPVDQIFTIATETAQKSQMQFYTFATGPVSPQLLYLFDRLQDKV